MKVKPLVAALIFAGLAIMAESIEASASSEGHTSSVAVAARLIVFLEPTQVIPEGWSCVSCKVGDPFFRRFPLGAGEFGVAGGIETHAHRATVADSGPSTGTVVVVGTDTFSPVRPGSDHGHGHRGASGPTAAADHLPPFRNLNVIKADRPGESLPPGAVILLDGVAIPAGFERYTAQDGYFIRGEGVPGIGGAAAHTHAFSLVSEPHLGGWNSARQHDVHASGVGHRHIFSARTSAQSNEPRHAAVVLARVVDPHGAPVPVGAIALFDSRPPSGWTVLSNPGGELHGAFLQGTEVPDLAMTGADVHQPETMVLTSSGPSHTQPLRGPHVEVRSSSTHTHSGTVRFDAADHRPPYLTVILARKDDQGPSGPPSFAFDRDPEPVRFEGGTPLFEAVHLIADPDVVHVGGRFRMFVSLFKPLPGEGSTVVIGVAESDDGQVFRFLRTEDDPILEATEPYELFGVETVAQVAWNGSRHLYYSTYEDGRPEVAQIALATGVDGLDLQKEGIVLSYDLAWELPWPLAGIEGEAVGGVIEPTVVVDPVAGRLNMYYNSLGLLDGEWTLPVGLATSTDGFLWTKHPSPIIDRPHRRPSWSHRAVHHPDVVYLEDSGWFVMAYTGRDLERMDSDPADIRLAFSRDGEEWRAIAENVAIEPRPGSWEEKEVLAPALVVVEDTVHLFYWSKSSPPDERWNIGHATMPRRDLLDLAAYVEAQPDDG